MSIPKTLVLEQIALLSTQYGRREVANQRAAFSISGEFSVRELMINSNSSSSIIVPSKILIAATDGTSMTVTTLRGGITQVQAFNQLLVLSSDFTSVVFNNTDNNLSAQPVRVRVIYS